MTHHVITTPLTTPTIICWTQDLTQDSEEMQQERRQEANIGDGTRPKSKAETVGDYYETAKKYANFERPG